jgi:hypothetical protein
MHIRLIAGALAIVPLLSSGALAQLAVSANDGNAVLVEGVNSVPAEIVPDYVTVIDLGVSPSRVVGEVPAPVSVVGPPQSVAVSHDETYALVVAAPPARFRSATRSPAPATWHFRPTARRHSSPVKTITRFRS